MAWFSWSRPEPPPEPAAPPPRDETAPELDLNALFTELPPNLEAPQAGDPKWMVTPEPAERQVSAQREAYTRVDLGKLRRDRERREHGQRFWQRLKRGDVDARDLPGQATASGLFFRFSDALFAPLRAAAESPGVIVGVIATALGFAAAFKLLISLFRHYFGGLS